MDTAEILVTVGGLILVALILWFFFGPRQADAPAVDRFATQEVDVVVRGGYSPARIEVRPGQPVRMNFLREQEDSATERVVFPQFGISRELPVGQSVPVEFTPETPGEYAFHGAREEIRGQLIVRS